MKSIPLIQAILKGFTRNWLSLLLLVLLPMILILTVFLSFNPGGLQKIPVGLIAQQGLTMDEFKVSTSSFLKIQEFASLPDCLHELKQYHKYVCIRIINEDPILLKVYFDNTREFIIWEIIERIKSTVDFLQKQRSQQMAGEVLSKFDNTIVQLDNYQNGLAEGNIKLSSYMTKTDSSILRLRNLKGDVAQTLTTMDNDISDVKASHREIKDEEYSLYSTGQNYLYNIERNAQYLNPINQTQEINSILNNVNTLRSLIQNYHTRFATSSNRLSNKITDYEQISDTGWDQISEIEIETTNLQSTRRELDTYQSLLSDTQSDLEYIKTDLSTVQELDPELLVNPIVITNYPVYVVDTKDKGTISKVLQDLNLVKLQTIYPKLLILMTVFLSLLISSFITVGEINSSSYLRIRLIKGISIHEFISVYISSFIIVLLPIICVLLFGVIFFKLQIFNNLIMVMIIEILLASIFIFMGIFLSYLIRKESITLLVTTFVLIFFLYFSGFLQPIERMSQAASIFATYTPVNMALFAFNKIVFYHQGAFNILFELFILFEWVFFAGFIGLLVKLLKK